MTPLPSSIIPFSYLIMLYWLPFIANNSRSSEIQADWITVVRKSLEEIKRLLLSNETDPDRIIFLTVFHTAEVSNEKTLLFGKLPCKQFLNLCSCLRNFFMISSYHQHYLNYAHHSKKFVLCQFQPIILIFCCII